MPPSTAKLTDSAGTDRLISALRTAEAITSLVFALAPPTRSAVIVFRQAVGLLQLQRPTFTQPFKASLIRREMSGLCRLALFLALAAAASAIPTLNLPTEEPPHVAAALEDTLHAEFVAWKSKVRACQRGTNLPELRGGRRAPGKRRHSGGAPRA